MDDGATESEKRYKGGLRRLDPSLYRGHSYVHWTMVLKDRQRGWLDHAHHEAFRMLLIHACAREFLCCPVYCLMPDHGHFLFIGCDERSDQFRAVNWLRTEWNRLLKPLGLQHQAYDSVLRERDRSREAFPDTVAYILRNPLRWELAEEWEAWPFSGAVFPGYPKLDLRKPMFWTNFWDAYQKHLR